MESASLLRQWPGNSQVDAEWSLSGDVGGLWDDCAVRLAGVRFSDHAQRLHGESLRSVREFQHEQG